MPAEVTRRARSRRKEVGVFDLDLGGHVSVEECADHHLDGDARTMNPMLAACYATHGKFAERPVERA
jgi:hypothetical protein